MSWALTAPINTGDLDAGNYAEVKIVGMHHRPNQQIIAVDLEYGNTVEGTWVRGHTPIEKISSYIISEQKYADLVAAHTSLDAELTFDALERGLYTHLLAEDVIDAGAVT